MMNKLFLAAMLLSISGSLNIYPQEQNSILYSTAEKYNERGFSTTASSLLDGNEIIGDYDGNLSMLYSSYYNLPGGLSFDLTLTFNANIDHRFFENTNMPAHEGGGYTVNKPGWIIGVKGFAVQTTNFEVNYYIPQNSSNPIFIGTEVPYLIPGYHYTNKLSYDPNVHYEDDYIDLLRADGSLLRLYNIDGTSRTGTYIESNTDGIGYAIVENRTTYLRNLWYKPGDGLTYYFEEEQAIYNGRDTMLADPSTARIMYLKSIFSPGGDTLFISYRHFVNHNPLKYGRKFFEQIHSNRKVKSKSNANVYDKNQLTMLNYSILNLFPDKYLTHITFNDYYKGESFKVVFNISGAKPAPLFSTTRHGDRTNTYYVSKFIDIFDRVNHIDYYYNVERVFKYDTDFTISSLSHLPSIIQYFNGKKTVLEYKNPGVSEYDFKFILENCDKTNFSNFITLKETFRDDFTNFMINKRIISDGESNIKWEKYKYINGNQNYIFCSPQIDNIKTIITKISSEPTNSSPDSIVIIKYFTKYKRPVRPYIVDSYDPGSSVIRLEKVVTEGNGLRKEENNEWDKGINPDPNSSNGGYFNGTFWLKKTTEIFEDNYAVAEKTTTFEYVTGPINFGNNNTRKIKTKTITTSPGELIKETGHKNFYPQLNQLNDKNFYYNIGLTDFEKVRNSNNSIKSQTNYTYFETNQYKIGKLKKVTQNAHSNNPVWSDYDYFTMQEDSFYYGFTKSIEQSNGVKTKYSYPGFVTDGKYSVIKDSVKGYLITNDNNKTLTNFAALGYQVKPFKTETIYNNNNDTITTWTCYDTKGNLLFEVDANRIYSEYKYDESGRIIRVNLPGSFYPGGATQVDTTFTPLNKVLYAQHRFSINSDGNISSNLRVIRNGEEDVEQRVFEEEINEAAKIDFDEEGDQEEIIIGGEEKNSNAYLFFEDIVNTDSIYSINYANLTFKTSSYSVTTGENKIVIIRGITSDYDNNAITYPTIGEKSFTFIENQVMTIDVSSIVNSCIANNKYLYGFVFDTELMDVTQGFKKFTFASSTADIPSFNLSTIIFNDEHSKARSTFVYNYNDLNNTVEVINRFTHDPQNQARIHSKLEYDVFGQLKKTSVKNQSGIFEEKSNTDYNYLGLKEKTTDAENRKVHYEYDYFSRVNKVYFVERNSSSPHQKFSYKPISYANLFEEVTVTDENNKKQISFYNKSGQIEKVQKTDENNTAMLETLFEYNDLQQLIRVIPPKGVNYKTEYQYDVHGNIIQKTSPDEGTVKYKYDKYGNLRFSLNTGLPATSKPLLFNKYDQFGRLILSGTLSTDDYNFDNLNPDNDNQFENYFTDTSHFVVVNMYDKYEKTGIFSTMSDPISYGLLVKRNLKGRLVATAFRDKTGERWNFKVYGYDELGRVSYYYIKIGNNSFMTIINNYDNMGNLVKQSANNQFYWWYDYDVQGRLHRVFSNIHNSKTSAFMEAWYSYNKAGQTSSLWYPSIVDHDEFINYSYNNRGWLNSINSYSTFYDYENGEILDKYRFNQNLVYDLNGNIASQTIYNYGGGNWGTQLSFSYIYDIYNRLREVGCSNPAFSEEFFYDSHGNITLKKKGHYSELNYQYVPNTNKISIISNEELRDYQFTFNSAGNLTSDGRRGINNMSYDRRNLLLSFTMSNNLTRYKYDDTGQRIGKNTGSNGVNELYLRDHTGKELAVYDLNNSGRLKSLNLYGNGLIGKVNVNWIPDSTCVSEVQGVPCTWQYFYRREDDRYYYIKDHLGSIRVTINTAGEIVSAQDYYAYGEVLRGYTYGDPNKRFLFTEKERDVESGYDYFGARFYDSDIARWTTIDPLDDRLQSIDPYNYSLNNPLNNIDPDGKFAINNFGKYGTYFMIFTSSWRVDIAIMGLGSKNNDNIFSASNVSISENLILDFTLNQFDRVFGTSIGIGKTVYDIAKTFIYAEEVFLKWEADKILFEQLDTERKIEGVSVFIRKEFSEDIARRNKTSYQFLNGFKWIEINTDVFSKIPKDKLEDKYRFSRDLIADQLRNDRNRLRRSTTSRGSYHYNKANSKGFFNDNYHPRNQ